MTLSKVDMTEIYDKDFSLHLLRFNNANAIEVNLKEGHSIFKKMWDLTPDVDNCDWYLNVPLQTLGFECNGVCDIYDKSLSITWNCEKHIKIRILYMIDPLLETTSKIVEEDLKRLFKLLGGRDE